MIACLEYYFTNITTTKYYQLVDASGNPVTIHRYIDFDEGRGFPLYPATQSNISGNYFNEPGAHWKEFKEKVQTQGDYAKPEGYIIYRRSINHICDKCRDYFSGGKPRETLGLDLKLKSEIKEDKSFWDKLF